MGLPRPTHDVGDRRIANFMKPHQKQNLDLGMDDKFSDVDLIFFPLTRILD